MNHGAAWVILEVRLKPYERNLLSLISSRKSAIEISSFVEQLHVDRYRSIETKISYKKSKKSVHITKFFDHFSRTIHCGDDPIIVAIPAHTISLKDGVLTFKYRIATDRSDPFNPGFEDRAESLTVETEP